MTNYARGRAAEYRARDTLQRRGFLVIRSAGSKGDWDLCAVHYATGQVLLVQVKRGSVSSADALRFERARIPSGAAAELWRAARGRFVTNARRHAAAPYSTKGE